MRRAALVLIAILAMGHSDGGQVYDPWCCNMRDCAPIPASAVTAGPDGYRVTLRPGDHPMVRSPVSHLVPYGTERRADDGRYHACLYPSQDTMRCFYAPPQGF